MGAEVPERKELCRDRAQDLPRDLGSNHSPSPVPAVQHARPPGSAKPEQASSGNSQGRAGGPTSTGTLDRELQHIAKRPSGPPEHPVCLTRLTPPEGQESSSSELVNNIDHRSSRRGAGAQGPGKQQTARIRKTRRLKPETPCSQQRRGGGVPSWDVSQAAGRTDTCFQGSLHSHWAG